MNTPQINSIEQQLEGVKENDEIAIANLWEQYYPALVRLAEKRLAALGVQQRAFNGEDVAASVMASFFRAVQRDRFAGLDTENGLFRLLRTITIRKVIDRKRQSQTLKGGSGNVRGESVFGSSTDSAASPGNGALGIEGVRDQTPSPEWIVMMEEECQGLFAMLPNSELQDIACLRLEGHSNSEIATKKNCSVATVERRLKEIRACWSSEIKSCGSGRATSP